MHILSSYFQSFFRNNKHISAGSVRAGNVIGGGDFKENRIIPDFFRAIYNKKTLLIRSPKSTRPWQHVLEALRGYIFLSMKLDKDKKKLVGLIEKPDEKADI
jgi:CDP-glucose 4,6-dehydratase